MKRLIKLTETDLNNIIKRIVRESDFSDSQPIQSHSQRYMFFSNLEQIKRQTELLLELDENEIEEILENGHDWAQDHIATAKESIDQVFDFLMNETKREESFLDEEDNLEDLALADESEGMNPNKALALSMTESKKKSGTKLCSRGKSAAKSKYDVYPSAYSNGYAVQVCQGKKPGLDGKKRCSPPYC